jgi:septal ring factor EnvC (AmiA/AmiB activator)
MNYDDDETTPRDHFADVLCLLDAAANAKKVAAGVKRLRKIEADVAAASETLARLQRQAAGIVEAAKAQAERIISAAEEETREQRNDLEHRERQLGSKMRLLAKLEGGADMRRAREAIAAEDDAAGNTTVFDVGDERSDHLGNPFVGGSTLTRSLDHKREATQ